jgi:hypothetical protein
MTAATTKTPVFDRFAAAVADFGSPFYAEERQRDIWNEASAFGLQLFLWGSLILSAAMFWVGGRAGLPYGLALLIFASLPSYFVLAYARRLGVDVPMKGSLRGWRLVAVLVAYTANLGGVAVALDQQRPSGGFLGGLLIGTAGAAGFLGGISWLQRQRRQRAEEADSTHPGL